MSQLFTIGRVVSNLEAKTSAKENPYLQFSLMERVGYGESSHQQYLQVWAWGYLSQQLVRSGVKAGSLIWVSGSLELEEYIKKDGRTRDKRLKLKLKDWGFVPGKKESKRTTDESATEDGSASHAGTIDGEREGLPE